MRALPLHLPAGADIRHSLEALARREQATGFVLSVVGNMSQACFACPGQDGPTLLSGELEIITLQGTIAPSGVHLHLSFSDGQCQVWGGHLEHGSLILKGADLLVGLLDSAPAAPVPAAAAAVAAAQIPAEPRLEIAVTPGCPWSIRALRMLRSLNIPYTLVDGLEGPKPQLFLDGSWIGGYKELSELHGSGELERLRLG